MNIFTQFFKSTSHEDRKHAVLQDLMRREAEITRNIFGPVPAGTKRDFFCLDKHTWIWYEEWTDQTGVRHQITTRYVVRPNEVLKSHNGGPYKRLTVEEARNFREATKVYFEKLKGSLYKDIVNKPAQG